MKYFERHDLNAVNKIILTGTTVKCVRVLRFIVL